MTMKVEEQTITVQRKNHPNDVRYPCRATHEVLEAGRKLLTSLSQEEKNELLENDLVLDEEETAELYDELKENDIIGLGILRKDGFRSNMYRIDKIHSGEDWMECENALTKEVEEITFQDISIAMALGFAEILYRDDKPFGVSDSYDFTIKYEVEEDDDENEDSSNASAQGSQNPNEGKLAGGTGSTDADSEEGAIDDDAAEASAPLLGNPFEAESDSSEELVEEPEPSIDFHETYHAFGFDTDSMTNYVIITPAKLWEDEGVICDQGTADPLAQKIGLEPLMDSTYEYDHKYTESQLRQLLTAFRSIEKSEMIQ